LERAAERSEPLRDAVDTQDAERQGVEQKRGGLPDRLGVLDQRILVLLPRGGNHPAVGPLVDFGSDHLHLGGARQRADDRLGQPFGADLQAARIEVVLGLVVDLL
ncbi:MAG: hypothetical protein ACK559_17980, partial [bacterium]